MPAASEKFLKEWKIEGKKLKEVFLREDKQKSSMILIEEIKRILRLG